MLAHSLTIRRTAAAVLTLCSTARAQVVVDNFGAAETVHQAAVLLRGRCSEDGEVVVARADGVAVFRAPVAGGRFVALVDTPPGRNEFRLRAGSHETALVLEHAPAKTPCRMRVAYATAEDGRTEYLTQREKDPQNYADKLDTLAKCLQAFTAESMRDAGFGRATFQLETDERGRVVVHTLRHPESREKLHALADGALYDAMKSQVEQRFDAAHDKVLLVMGFSGYDSQARKPKAHTALGGGMLGVFSNLGMHTWPDSLADVPRAFADTTAIDESRVFADVYVGRGERTPTFQLAATTMGATLHEMGHTLGLPHTADPRCIMARGFDYLHLALTAGAERDGRLQPHPPDHAAYWSPAYALRLAYSPWFALKAPVRPRAKPPSSKVEKDGAEVLVTSAAGIAAFSVHSGGNEVTRAVVERVPDGKLARASFDFDALRSEHDLQGPLTIHVYDVEGQLLVIDEALLGNHDDFVRRWQIGSPKPWDRRRAELPDDDELAVWRKKLARERPVDTTPTDARYFRSVDLLEQLPNSADRYVVLRAQVERARAGPAELYFGGDDGARVWVNGALVLDRPEVTVFGIDQLHVPIQLEAGLNEVLVQSFQAGGGWGFSLRIGAAAR